MTELARPRVVHLINHLGRGGTERQLFLVLRAMDPAAFEHHVVVFNASENLVYDEALAAAGVRVHHLPRECRSVARRLAHLVRLLRRLEARVVHSWTVHDNPYAALAGRLARVPVRWGSLRGSLRSEALRSLAAPLRFLVLHGVPRQVVNCQALAGELAAAGIPASRVHVLPNCVELGPPRPPAELGALGIGADQPVVATVGNLRRIKNHEMFVAAMAEVLAARPMARALIVGQPLASEPDYGRAVEAEIGSRGLKGTLMLTGFREDVADLLSRSTVLCLTSHSEGMPNAVLEAMAAARPVVAVRVGGVPELVDDGVTGVLVPPGDAPAMARAVGRLLDEPALAARFGAAGRERAERLFACEVAARRLAELYRAALAARRA